MKSKKLLLIFIASSLSLVSCGNKDKEEVHVHTYETSWKYNNTMHWHASNCDHKGFASDLGEHNLTSWAVSKQPSYVETGLKERHCTICNYTETDNIPKLERTGTCTFTLYTFNDFHGAVNEYPSQKHTGLAKFATYLKNASKEDNVVIVDSGDTFQGSIESNYNNGKLITDVFNYAHVDVHTLGNHDFDWGESKIEENASRSSSNDDWSMKYLGGNIYDYEFSSHKEGYIQQSRLGDEYYIKTLQNGLRIGVIGVIGLSQITSICSPLVEDICFKDHVDCIKEISDELRTTNACDVVIASIHEGASSVKGLGLSNVSPVSGKKYVDYVACGHSHRDECYTVDDVYYTQAACYGEMLYKSTFTVTDSVVTNCTVEKVPYDTITSSVTRVDPNITSIIESYAKDYSSVGEEVLSTISGNFYKDEQMPNMLSKAMYLEANKEGYTVDLACTNAARYDIRNSSEMTYASLYEAFPFDNVIYIVKCKGDSNVRQLSYSGNNYYHSSSLTSMDTSKWYTVAIIDYLLWHTNSDRQYDYFDHSADNMQIIGTLKKNNDNYLYRDVCADYIRGITGTLYASDYSNSATGFNKLTY